MWFKYLLIVLIVLYAVSTIMTILVIDKERTPHTRVSAVFTTIVNALLIWGIAVYF